VTSLVGGLLPSMINDLAELLARVRQGDEDASRSVVARYELAIRVAVRTNLSDPRLRRQFDSLDVCQSVLASFFFHLTSGAYDLSDPAQLSALLTKMAQNKVRMLVRDQLRQRRDVRRLSHGNFDEGAIRAMNVGPEAAVDDQDLIDRALDMMPPEIRAIADRRMAGELWPEIADAMGGTPDSRRKQFERAVLPIAQSLEALA
jgi:DNA-directed RNA polymerase specialized sigma24 family protein